MTTFFAEIFKESSCSDKYEDLWYWLCADQFKSSFTDVNFILHRILKNMKAKASAQIGPFFSPNFCQLSLRKSDVSSF